MSELQNRYGKRTANIVKDLLGGKTVKQIARRRRLPVTSVAVTAGNFTRGTYNAFI